MTYLLRSIALVNLVLFSISMTAQNQTKEFKLALVQMYVTPGDLQKNLSHATQLIDEAAAGGANVILSPSSWAVPPDHDNAKDPYGDTWRKAYIPVAKEFSVWIVSASNVGPVTEGPWKNWKCIGCSLIVGPDGKEKLMGPYGEHAEKILYYTINPIQRPARGTRWNGFKPEIL